MTPILKLMLALATILGVVVTTVNSMPPKKQNFGNLICDGNFKKDQLQNAAQEALQAIRSTRVPTTSNNQGKRGQHVFNNNLLRFHRNVLQDLLNEVGASEQLDDLMKGLMPLSEDQQKAIGTEMVVDFRNFSSVDALLSALTKGGRVKFFWTHEAQAAFSELKCRFISVPILTFPEPDKPLLVKFHKNLEYIQQTK